MTTRVEASQRSSSATAPNGSREAGTGRAAARGPGPGVAIRCSELTRDFGSVRAVDDLSLEVPAGSVFGFLGPNGSGKTTTIRLLLGLLEPTGGRAEVLGFDTSREGDAVRQRAGALLEHTGLYERLTAEDNLDFYGRFWRLSASEREARIRELQPGTRVARQREGIPD